MPKEYEKPTRKEYQETGKLVGGTQKPSSRLYGEGGFVKHGNMVHLTHGARAGYTKKVGKR